MKKFKGKDLLELLGNDVNEWRSDVLSNKDNFTMVAYENLQTRRLDLQREVDKIFQEIDERSFKEDIINKKKIKFLRILACVCLALVGVFPVNLIVSIFSIIISAKLTDDTINNNLLLDELKMELYYIKTILNNCESLLEESKELNVRNITKEALEILPEDIVVGLDNPSLNEDFSLKLTKK